MAQDMRGRSWRSLTARLNPIKEYLRPTPSDAPSAENGYPDGTTKRPSWSQRLAGRSNSDSDDVVTTERVVLLPGWASKRYHKLPYRAGSPYDIEIFVSGYVVKDKATDVLSRSQRTLLRLAKSFAALPKLPDQDDHEDTPSQSTENLLEGMRLPPRPEDITPELEVLALRHSQHAPLIGTASTPTPSRPSSPSSTSLDLPSARPLKTSSSGANGLDIMRWHSNLETRLRPFWSGVLSNRTLRFSVRHHFENLTEAGSKISSQSEIPLAEESTTTDANGSFKIRIIIPWNTHHPRDEPIHSVNTDKEHAWFVTAELMPLPPSRPPTPTESYPTRVSARPSSTPTPTTTELVTLAHSPVRVISDIDDTVKLSGVTRGARAVFHNVFVKDLHENVIPGMGEWYSEMWRRGVRFHYVSNGPFELLPVINDFFELAKLPAGSVRLRSYGTRSLFSGLLSAPAERKRDGLVEVLYSFSTSRFILIGDSGEQDLELYASIAQEYPWQIGCIFIRDVNIYEDGGGGIEDPTGICVRDGRITAQDLQTKRKGSSGTQVPRGGRSPRSTSSQLFPPTPAVSRTSSGSSDGTIPTLLYTDPLSSEPGSDDILQPLPPYMPINRPPNSESEKQRMNLQIRLWKVCTELQPEIVIRVFREPQECVEAFQIIG
jgi:phosphatidate phosphatase APP1